jgi:hypothetical protein
MNRQSLLSRAWTAVRVARHVLLGHGVISNVHFNSHIEIGPEPQNIFFYRSCHFPQGLSATDRGPVTLVDDELMFYNDPTAPKEHS